MAPPLVSVVVPTFQKAAFLRDAIASVLEQDHEPLQLVLTDNASTDGTREIVEEAAAAEPERVTALFSATNTGIPSNFNRGLRAARGEYVAWLDGDDLMLPGRLRKQVAALEAAPDAAGCVADAEVFDSDTGRVLGRFSELHNGGRRLREGGVELWLDPFYMTLPSTTMVRRGACPPHGFDERLSYANDWLFYAEVFSTGRCVVVDEVLGRYRRHADNVTGQPGATRTGFEEGLRAMTMFAERHPEHARAAASVRAALQLGEARRRWHAGDRRAALRSGRAAIGEGGFTRLASRWAAARRA